LEPTPTQKKQSGGAAHKLRDSMPILDVDVVTEIQQMREERGHELLH
jgi:hypothetical protein